MPSGWKVKKGKKSFDNRFILNSPCGKTFHTLISAVLWMQKNDYKVKDIDTMRGNLKHEGWKESDYLPTGWTLLYYKPSNGFHYMSDTGKFFHSAKRAMDFMKKNNFNPQFAKDLKTNMNESKKFTGKLKFKWLAGDHTLPKGWKRRLVKGTGRENKNEDVEFILSADGIQFKSRFEALHFMMNNKYKKEQVEELRKRLLISDEKWKKHELLPTDWIWKWNGEGMGKEKNPSSTSITYFSQEGIVMHSMKACMEVRNPFVHTFFANISNFSSNLSFNRS